MSVILAISPHPDDETLGCGGTLLRHRDEGDEINWLLVTTVHPSDEDGRETIAQNDKVNAKVAADYGFASLIKLGFRPAQLDVVPMTELIEAIGGAIKRIKPDTLYVPFPGDAHSDHRCVFDAVAACCKWFRYPSVRRVYACEIPSETDFGLRPEASAFRPNVFVDVTDWLDQKIRILGHFTGEMGDHPFPRSDEHVKALATHRGAQAGCTAAEAFMLIKEVR